ncbi:MAG TPA: methyl-accepting chemotaxis protein [Spirochaetota bacterium]|nr:methyl-accepting chemotaxis protein [Spirochaetota bacterium]HPV42981.1 methyl-accepting chemotaxis protein [Spirochaetota bacterium]
MTEAEDRILQYNKILKQLFFRTEIISNVILVPVTTAILLYQLGMGLMNNLIFLATLVVASSGNLVVSYYLFKRDTSSITTAFAKWARGTELPDDEYLVIRNTLFGYPLKQSLKVIVRWVLIMPAFIIFVHILSEITFLQEFNMWTLLLLNIVLSSIIYFRMSERAVEAIARLGAINRDVESTGGRKRHLSFSLTYTVLSYIVLTLIFITGAVVNLNYNLIESMFLDDLKTGSALIDQNVEKLLDDKASEIKLIAADEGIARARGIGAHNNLMRKLANETEYYEYAFVAGAAPVMVSSSAPALTGAPVKQPDIADAIARARKGEPTLSGVHVSPLNGRPAVVFCVPIREGNAVAAVIGLSFNLEAATRRLIGNEKIGETGFTYLVDRDLMGMAHPNPKNLTTDMKKSEWGQKLMKLADGSALPYFEDGEFKILYNRINKRYGFRTISSINLSDIDGKLIGSGILMIVVSLLGLLIVAVSMFILINRKIEPIEESARVIEKIAQGDLNQRLTVYSDDEVGRMSIKLISFMRRLRHAIRNIKNISDEMASSSTEMSATVTSFSDNAQNQASSAEEVTATVEEMAAGMDSVVNGALIQFESMDSLRTQLADLSGKIEEMSVQIQNAFTIADRVAGKARDGEQLLKDMSGSMSKIISSSNEMTNILSIITGISEQINLLSLNASIEAARAGDAGRGFAVVADEVSKLADQTASSIKDIDRHIKNNAEETSRGIENSQKTVETISMIIEGVTTMRTMMNTIMEFMQSQTEINKNVNKKAEYSGSLSNDIRVATEEQKNAVNEIVRSVSNINELTQANASGSEQLSGTSENLAAMAESLKQAVDYFKI